jgi:MoxR-like ATPase
VEVAEFAERFDGVRKEIARVLVGQDEVVTGALVALFARGHVLLEGPPGLGKTLLVRALGSVLGCTFKRIQFTPDLMPSDVTGSNVFNQRSDGFEFVPGPIFTQVLLGDEINRAPAKTQSSLLEAMQERQVTVDGTTRPLPGPFFVIATQNPIESQGTYPLPEAQLDRFLMKLLVRYPDAESEQNILRAHLAGFDAGEIEKVGLRALLDASGIFAMQEVSRRVRVDDAVVAYITELVRRTREHRSIYVGASPRASIALLRCAQILAASEARDFVTPDDVKGLAGAILRHRLTLHPDAEVQGLTADDCIAGIFRETPAPRIGS